MSNEQSADGAPLAPLTPTRADSGRPARWRFDRFAEAASEYVSRGVFFAACVLLVLMWAPSYFLLRNFDTWQLLINTATTIVTFLLVALLQNTGRRSDHAIHRKLDALADGLADLMEHELHGDPADLGRDIQELKDAVGLERPTGRGHRNGGSQVAVSPPSHRGHRPSKPCTGTTHFTTEAPGSSSPASP